MVNNATGLRNRIWPAWNFQTYTSMVGSTCSASPIKRLIWLFYLNLNGPGPTLTDKIATWSTLRTVEFRSNRPKAWPTDPSCTKKSDDPTVHSRAHIQKLVDSDLSGFGPTWTQIQTTLDQPELTTLMLDYALLVLQGGLDSGYLKKLKRGRF